MLNREGRKQRTERTCKCFRDTRTRVRGPISRSTPAMPPTRPDRRAAGRAERLRLTVCVWWVWWAPAVGRVAGAPPPAPQQSDLSLRRAFLGLDKCNACVGTSVCKKLFRNQIMFDWWISPHAAATAALAQKQSFMANLTDDSSSWRLVALSFLSSPDLHAPSDRSICRSAGRQSPCSIEVVLKATRRFKSLNQSHILLPHMVEGLRTPLLRCPSQRLLDRIVRRYAEVVDVGSVQMKHFSERDKLRLLHTLAINQQPLMLQMFPGTEGWPFPRYQGSCGRLMVWASSRPLWGLYGSSEEFFQRVDVAYQLLQITQGLGHNSLGFQIYYTRLEEDMFGLLDDQRVFISDASSLGVIDLEQGLPPDTPSHSGSGKDIFSCLGQGLSTCHRPPPCSSVRPTQSFTLLCTVLLPRLLLTPSEKGEGKAARLPEDVPLMLGVCANPSQPDWKIMAAVGSLIDLLKPLRPCNPYFAYRYPECTYNHKY
ncbi:divergent protein kinase domain 2B isoform X1 [Esox lucius]|uniref:FAM69 protein-kinase domain-containing protein n=1 Tax=Esox lucius TaxID=8010 RepID=A0A3P9ACJ6_ESOLU|nr:divergent protein kinase domain 2B isoform X1 [Esox lucius]